MYSFSGYVAHRILFNGVVYNKSWVEIEGDFFIAIKPFEREIPMTLFTDGLLCVIAAHDYRSFLTQTTTLLQKKRSTSFDIIASLCTTTVVENDPIVLLSIDPVDFSANVTELYSNIEIVNFL